MSANRSSIWPAEAFFVFDEEVAATRAHEIAMYSRTFSELAELAVYGKAARTPITRAIQVQVVDEQSYAARDPAGVVPAIIR
ncbi:hypothetical protein [Nonomuraea sp. NPDC049158]|uniref:hypothetical protein n=1 Tax=Nonomuraea sp. NPDC049158 TaxID=3155649 RepID=UPI0034083E3E